MEVAWLPVVEGVCHLEEGVGEKRGGSDLLRCSPETGAPLVGRIVGQAGEIPIKFGYRHEIGQ